MTKFIETSCAAVFFLSTVTLACDYPDRASIPNGKKATKDEMVAGQKSVKKYMTDMEEYLACIEEEDEERRADIEEPDPIVEAQHEEMLVKKHNAAIDDMETIAAQFNEEVRAYKDRKD